MMVIYAKNIDKYVFKNKNRVEICGKLRCLNGSEFCESSSYIHLQYLQWPEHHSLSSDIEWCRTLHHEATGLRELRASAVGRCWKCEGFVSAPWLLDVAGGKSTQEIVGLTIQMYPLYLKFLMCQFQKCIQIWSNMVVPCVFCIITWIFKRSK